MSASGRGIQRQLCLPQGAEVAMMKNKIEVAANVVVILLAVVIGSVFLMDRFASPGPGPNEVKVGDQLPGLPAYNWRTHERTLVLALRKGCHFCEDSMPFYRRLAKLEQSNQIGVHLIAVFPDDPAVARQVVETQHLTIEVLPGTELGQVKVQATPTLMLVDEQC